MIRITNLKLDIRHDRQDIKNSILKKLRIPDTRLLDFIIVKKSLDARDKSHIIYVYTVDVRTDCEDSILRRNKDSHITRSERTEYRYPARGYDPIPYRPLVIGSGPAGLFAAYFLAKEGFAPIVIERGDRVEDRIAAVEEFWNTGRLDPQSNIQFGEGGAGTFSDGKLYTGVHDPSGRNHLVLQTFVLHGASQEILYQAKPHLGTDVLAGIVAGMREEIIRNGGEFRFRTCFQQFLTEGLQVKGIITDTGEVIRSEHVILAIGHSARDTFEYLIRHTELDLTAKPFAVGVRAEHRQADINAAQYGGGFDGILPAAEYKLTCKTVGQHSVYSFCMCPGGYVVNSSSENGCQCINGMSYSGRDSENANSAIVVAVSPSDDPEENIRFQRELEQRAYTLGNGRIVSQRLEDFEKGIPSETFGHIRPVHKGQTVFGDINQILPVQICDDIKEAMHIFGRRIRGFDDPDVVLSAVETRTSSPVRILRDEHMEACIKGVFPVGEGAGYAGGITSAAIDGIKAFEELYSRFSGYSL